MANLQGYLSECLKILQYYMERTVCKRIVTHLCLYAKCKQHLMFNLMFNYGPDIPVICCTYPGIF